MKVVLTGLGLPSQMKKYVNDGTVESFELWNPSNLGYLAGYAAAHLASGTPLQAGSTFRSGSLNKTYTMASGHGRAFGDPRPADGLRQVERQQFQLLTELIRGMRSPARAVTQPGQGVPHR